MKKEIKLFMAYAPEDEDYQKELSKHLAGLKEDGIISEISAAEVLPGANIMNDLRKRMGQSDIIALLLSADFLGTNHGVELEEMAFAQMAKKGTRLVPIKIREVTLGRAYAQFSMLPGQNKPVDDPEWGGRDAAYANITGGIRQLAESMKEIHPPGRKLGETVKSEPERSSTTSAAKVVDSNAKSNIGMKVGIGIVAALAIAAAVFFLMPNDGPIVDPPTEPTDQQAYLAAKKIDDTTAYQKYIKDYPKGDFLDEAETKIARLKDEIYTAADRAEWAKATATDNLIGYSYYIEHYPNGENVEVAKERIQQLSTDADEDKAWQKAQSSNTKSSFLLYVQEYGDSGRYYDDAITSIESLLTSSGWTFYGKKKSDDTMQDDRYFDRLSGEKNAKPAVGDFIIVKKPISVRRGPSTEYDKTGVVLKREALAEITEVSNDYWVQIKF